MTLRTYKSSNGSMQFASHTPGKLLYALAYLEIEQ